MAEPWEFVVTEDGYTFLSQEELDDYRTHKIQTDWLEAKSS